MPSVIAIPRAAQRNEPWANGAGSTTVILREPDSADWRVRVSIARVEGDGPFSELAATRRTLVPLDAPMTLCFSDDRSITAARMQAVEFAGSPAPTGLLPEGPTRDFNLMLRGDARGEVIARTLVDSMLLPHAAGVRWLVCVAAGRAELHAGDASPLALDAGDAALFDGTAEPASHHRVRGAGDILLVRLYA